MSCLEDENWLYFRMFAKEEHFRNWKDQLSWYYRTLNSIVKPLLHENKESIDAVFFAEYGPMLYEAEGKCEKPATELGGRNVVHIKLRLCVKENKESVKGELIEKIESHKDGLILNYEVCEYNPRDDIGNRFCKTSDGAVDDERLMNFIKFWDSCCRYVLSIITIENRLQNENVDIKGMPHLVYNSLGTFIPLGYQSRRCPNCGEILCMNTSNVQYSGQCLRCSGVAPFRGNL